MGRAKNDPNAFALVGKSFAGPDLFVVRNDGNVGVNNTSPTATLDVNGTFRLADGTQGAGKVLTSNASGNASWQSVPSGWGLSGSALTNSTTNYIGTSDAQGLNIKTNGITRITVTETGNVGIGTNVNPSAPLVVQGQGTNAGILKLYNSNGSSNDKTFLGFNIVNTGNDALDLARIGSERSLGGGEGRLFFTTGALGAQTERMRIDEFGKVGIGTSSPTEFVQLQNPASDVNMSLISNSPNNAGVSFGHTGNHFMGNIRYNLNTNSMNFWTNNTPDQLVILSTGNVGIGTNNPATKLHMHNSLSNSVQLRMTHTATSTFGLVLSSDNLSAALLNYDNTPFYLGSNGANKMTITGTGVSVGFGAPTATFQVNGTTRLVDGTEGNNKVLTSDASGNASWQQVGVPSGAIMAFGGTTIPAGWLLCDGSFYNRVGTYANLFAAIGTAWGAPSGTTFNVPDMRGMFLRGVDGGVGADPNAATRTFNINAAGNTGNNVGSEQADEFESHTHTLPGTANGLGLGLTGTFYNSSGAPGNTTTAAGGSTETRPKNVYVYYIY